MYLNMPRPRDPPGRPLGAVKRAQMGRKEIRKLRAYVVSSKLTCMSNRYLRCYGGSRLPTIMPSRYRIRIRTESLGCLGFRLTWHLRGPRSANIRHSRGVARPSWMSGPLPDCATISHRSPSTRGRPAPRFVSGALKGFSLEGAPYISKLGPVGTILICPGPGTRRGRH